MTGVSETPTALLVALGVAVVVQVTLEVVALVVLFRTPRERVQLGMRWPWVLIILLINTLGAVVFLVLGRRAAPAVDQAPAPPHDDVVRDVVDDLYGRGPEP
ncbi:MAG: PLD nuclease N-terminal domain-containing protein [Micrococcales bacterium]|nr:PLD nuclease N-terminal domain-containing protein [Micrococcales bacterium]